MAVSDAQVIRLLLVQRLGRLNERIASGEARSTMYHDRLSGARTELILAIKQVDAFIAGDPGALSIGEEQPA